MSLAEAVERGSKESRKERGKRRNQPDIRRVGDGWRKWIGRCGHGVAGGVGATGLAEKYTTAGWRDRRRRCRSPAGQSLGDAGKQARLQDEKRDGLRTMRREEKRRQELVQMQMRGLRRCSERIGARLELAQSRGVDARRGEEQGEINASGRRSSTTSSW